MDEKPEVDIESFKYRYPRILAEIEQADPDILCLQEVDKLRTYEPEFKALCYEFIVFTRDVDKAKGGSMFTPAIGVKKSKFKVLEHREIKGNSILE